MDKLLIKAGFRVFVSQGLDLTDKEGKRHRPDKRVEFQPGMVITDADVPEGQTAQDWIDKGLAERPDASEPAAPADEHA